MTGTADRPAAEAGAAAELRWVRPGWALVRAVAAAARELQGADPLQPVRVVAADGATVDALRRSLPLAGGACGLDIGGTLRLARALAAPELAHTRSAPPVAVLAAVQHVLGDPATCPPAFRSCAAHPATHDAVVRAVRALGGVFTLPHPDAALASLAGGRESAEALCRVVAAVRTRLLASGAADDALVLTTATTALTATPRATAPRSGPTTDPGATPLVVVVTQQFPPAHVAFLAALARRAPRTIVVAASARHAEVAVAAHVARILGGTVPVEAAHALHEPGPVPARVLSCPDHDEEVREVVRQVLALLDAGVVADRIAVLYPAQGPHRAAIGHALAAAGVAARGEVTPRLGGSTAGQVLRLLLALAVDGLRRTTLVELARLAPFGRGTGRADAWARVAARYGVVDERDWPAFAALELAEDDRHARDHAGLRDFVQRQRGRRDALRASSTWSDAAQALSRWFAAQCGTVETRRSRWAAYAPWQREAAEQVESLLTELGEIDGLGLPFSLRTLRDVVEAGLDADVATSESKGAGVLVDQVVGGAGMVADHVFVVGANEHLLPGRPPDDLVLTAEHGPEPLGVLTGPSNRPLRDRRGFDAALDGAGASVTVTFARWDVRAGGELYPSPLLPAGAEHHHLASHAARLHDPHAPWLTEAEWLVRDRQRGNQVLGRRQRAVTARLQDAPGDHDGQVGPLGDLVPFARLDAEGLPREVGITSFEEWVGCGLRYFVTRVLDAPVDDVDPERLADVEPRRKGTLVHLVVEELVRRWIGEHPHADGPWIATDDDVEAMCALAAQLLDEVAAPWLREHRLGHAEMWRARRTQMLAALRRGIEAERADPCTPLEPELSFGRRFGGARPAVVWRAPSGHEVHFTGSIDRLDRLPDGSLRVMDVKSGKRHPFASIGPLEPFGASGDKLQLAFYGWAAEQFLGERVTRSAYRFTGHASTQEDVVLELDDEVGAALQARLGEIAAGIAAGRFEPGPVGAFGCDVCTPDRLGASELNQRRIEWAGELADADDDVGGDRPGGPEQRVLS